MHLEKKWEKSKIIRKGTEEERVKRIPIDIVIATRACLLLETEKK
jgi:hypothetical protein